MKGVSIPYFNRWESLTPSLHSIYNAAKFDSAGYGSIVMMNNGSTEMKAVEESDRFLSAMAGLGWSVRHESRARNISMADGMAGMFDAMRLVGCDVWACLPSDWVNSIHLFQALSRTEEYLVKPYHAIHIHPDAGRFRKYIGSKVKDDPWFCDCGVRFDWGGLWSKEFVETIRPESAFRDANGILNASNTRVWTTMTARGWRVGMLKESLGEHIGIVSTLDPKRRTLEGHPFALDPCLYTEPKILLKPREA